MKLTNDYKSLVDRYNKVNLVEHQGIVFPEECLWLRQGDETVEVKDNFAKYYKLPSEVASHREEIMSAHGGAIIYDNLNIRLDRVELDGDKVIAQTSRTHYFDSLLTNRVCDYRFGKTGMTVRELYEYGPAITPLHVSRVSNHLGFNGFVLASDTGRIPFILRKKNLSVAGGTWATSIGASLKTMYALDCKNDFKMKEYAFGHAIVGEIVDEIRVKQDKALNPENAQNSIFAFYRDLVECGKPQFLFCLQLEDTTEEDLKKSIEKNTDENDVTTDGSEVMFFSVKDLKEAEYGIDYIKINGKVYNMVPFSIVSVVLLLKYLNRKG